MSAPPLSVTLPSGFARFNAMVSPRDQISASQLGTGFAVLASRSLREEHEQVVCGRWGWKGFWSPAGAGFSPRGAGLRLMTPPPSPPRILSEAAGETPDAGGESGRLRGREGGSTGDLPAVDSQKCIFSFPFQAS